MGVALESSLSQGIPLTQALKEVFPPGRTGGPIDKSTGTRWINQGVIGRRGNRVRLKAVKVGGTFYVRLEDCFEFIAALND